MTKRRSRGEGSLHWSKTRQRWIAEVTVGYDSRGKRITRKASAKTKTDAKAKLKEMVRDLDDGLSIAPHNYTVADAVQNWLDFGLSGDAPATSPSAGAWPTRTSSRPSAPGSCASCLPTT